MGAKSNVLTKSSFVSSMSWRRLQESNPRPSDYKSAALPSELNRARPTSAPLAAGFSQTSVKNLRGSVRRWARPDERRCTRFGAREAIGLRRRSSGRAVGCGAGDEVADHVAARGRAAGGCAAALALAGVVRGSIRGRGRGLVEQSADRVIPLRPGAGFRSAIGDDGIGGVRPGGEAVGLQGADGRDQQWLAPRTGRADPEPAPRGCW